MQISNCEQQKDCRRKPAHSKRTKRKQPVESAGPDYSQTGKILETIIPGWTGGVVAST